MKRVVVLCILILVFVLFTALGISESIKQDDRETETLNLLESKLSSIESDINILKYELAEANNTIKSQQDWIGFLIDNSVSRLDLNIMIEDIVMMEWESLNGDY